MGYAEVIEEQHTLAAIWRSPAGLAMAERIIEGLPADIGVGARRMRGFMVGSLSSAAPFVVNSPITRLIAEAARSIPPWTLEREYLPEPEMFVRLGEPVYHPSEKAEDLIGVIALGLAQTVNEDSGNDYLCVVPYFLDEAHRLTPCSFLLWGYGQPTHQGATKGAGEELYCLVGALLQFLKQRVLTVSQRPLLNRAARKRLARIVDHVPEVRVIELRARDYQQRDESQPRDVEYSCQWLVRGHWHNYHTREGLKPIFVLPYVKGPSDKPLRVAEKVAYEVVR